MPSKQHTLARQKGRRFKAQSSSFKVGGIALTLKLEL
jgi:hypothetical protein